MMSSIYKYKNTIGLFLLAMYFFIATPASIWHHHKPVSPSLKSTASISKTCLSEAEGSSNGPCKICTHHYADCLQTAIHFVDFATSSTGNIHHVSSVSLVKAPLYSLSNKGPPSGTAI